MHQQSFGAAAIKSGNIKSSNMYAILLTYILSPHVYIGSSIDPEDIPYLFSLFLLFVPAGAILFLTIKVHA
jgi:hypothetical protein